MKVSFQTGIRAWKKTEIDFILNVLNDQRSWGIPVKRSFDQNYDWVVFLDDSFTIQRQYPSLGKTALSVTDSTDPHQYGIITIFNIDNWETIPIAAKRSGFESLEQYRTYLINHEFGHAIGHGHSRCSGIDGALAPVMLQQTKGTGNCIPCVWPRECGDIK